MHSVSPYTGQQWVEPVEPTLPVILRRSLLWSLVLDTLLSLFQSERWYRRHAGQIPAHLKNKYNIFECVITMRIGGLLLDPAEKKMYWLVSYSRLAELVNRNLAEGSPICLRKKVAYNEPDMVFGDDHYSIFHKQICYHFIFRTIVINFLKCE